MVAVSHPILGTNANDEAGCGGGDHLECAPGGMLADDLWARTSKCPHEEHTRLVHSRQHGAQRAEGRAPDPPVVAVQLDWRTGRRRCEAVHASDAIGGSTACCAAA